MKGKALIVIILAIALGIGSIIYWQYGNKDNIQPSIALVSPNGGETLEKGSEYKIVWNTQEIPSTDKISVTIRRVEPPALPEEGQEFDPIIFINLENTGSVDWIVSDNYPEGNYIIGINSYSSIPVTNSVSDESDETFRIVEEEKSKQNGIYVFLTDEKYDGNLGGREGADEKCMFSAESVCKQGTIHSLITIDNGDSIINMAENYDIDINIPVYWYNRETDLSLLLAENWNEMIKENIVNGQEEGTGKGEWSKDFPWTGGLGNESSLATCNQWTSNEGNLETGSGPYGTIGSPDKEFLFVSDGWAGISFAMVCKNTRYLRCLCEN
jgi:hypothetical protein